MLYDALHSELKKWKWCLWWHKMNNQPLTCDWLKQKFSVNYCSIGETDRWWNSCWSHLMMRCWDAKTPRIAVAAGDGETDTKCGSRSWCFYVAICHCVWLLLYVAMWCECDVCRLLWQGRSASWIWRVSWSHTSCISIDKLMFTSSFLSSFLWTDFFRQIWY